LICFRIAVERAEAWEFRSAFPQESQNAPTKSGRAATFWRWAHDGGFFQIAPRAYIRRTPYIFCRGWLL